jgi:hypothetical protein
MQTLHFYQIHNLQGSGLTAYSQISKTFSQHESHVKCFNYIFLLLSSLINIYFFLKHKFNF